MVGGQVYIGRRREAQRANDEIMFSTPTLAKKGGDQLQGEMVKYTIKYEGVVTKKAYTEGIKFPIEIEHEDKTYTGTGWLQLEKVSEDEKGNVIVHIKLKLDIPELGDVDYDSKRDGGDTGLVSRSGILRYLVEADMSTDNSKFNETMPVEEWKTYKILNNTATLGFYRHEEILGVGERQATGKLSIISANSENVRMRIEGQAGMQVNIGLYDMNGRQVSPLGFSGMRLTQPSEELDFTLPQNLSSGTYMLMITGPNMKESVPLHIVR